MRIVEVFSHLNGKEFIDARKRDLWSEIKSCIEGLDADALEKKVSKEKRMSGRSLYSPRKINARFNEEFTSRGWKEVRLPFWVTTSEAMSRSIVALDQDAQKKAILDAGLQAHRSLNQIDFVKDRVAVEVQFGKYAFTSHDLFVKHVAFFVANSIDVGVEIVPMKSMQQQMSSGVGYYEAVLFNMVRQGRTIPSVPLVLIGVAP